MIFGIWLRSSKMPGSRWSPVIIGRAVVNKMDDALATASTGRQHIDHQQDGKWNANDPQHSKDSAFSDGHGQVPLSFQSCAVNDLWQMVAWLKDAVLPLVAQVHGPRSGQ